MLVGGGAYAGLKLCAILRGLCGFAKSCRAKFCGVLCSRID